MTQRKLEKLGTAVTNNPESLKGRAALDIYLRAIDTNVISISQQLNLLSSAVIELQANIEALAVSETQVSGAALIKYRR